MSVQAKTLLAGIATLGVAHYGLQKDWKTSAVWGGIAIAAYLVVTLLPDEII
jgi:hypothetical protein